MPKQVFRCVKALLPRRAWLYGAGFMSLVAVCSVSIHPYGQLKRPDRQAIPASELPVWPQVGAVLNRSCMDCHSSHTVWPWYSYVAPMSWLVEKDVRRGRDRLNLSEWNGYTLQQQKELLADIASAVKNREMPLPQYTLIHRGSKLSDADTDLV